MIILHILGLLIIVSKFFMMDIFPSLHFLPNNPVSYYLLRAVEGEDAPLTASEARFFKYATLFSNLAVLILYQVFEGIYDYYFR